MFMGAFTCIHAASSTHAYSPAKTQLLYLFLETTVFFRNYLKLGSHPKGGSCYVEEGLFFKEQGYIIIAFEGHI